MASTHDYEIDSRNEDIMIYINGQFFHRSDAKVSVMDSGYLLGDGVWEGIRLYKGTMIHLDQHLDRLYHGAKKLMIDIGFSKEEIIKFIFDTIRVNKMNSGVHIRLIITRGLKKTPYQHPNANIGACSIIIIPEYKEANEIVNKKGIKLVTVNTRRGMQNSQDPRLNTLSKLNCIIACIEADKAGADEGIMLDINGNVSTCNSTNFFIIKDKQIWTSTGEYCLPGVTRKAIIEICKKNNLIIFEKDFSIQEVHSADEAFVTGTFAGIIPVVKIDGYEISNGKRGKITHLIQNFYKSKLSQLYSNRI